MAAGQLTCLLVVLATISYVSAQIQYGFSQTSYTVEEGATAIVSVVKTGENVNTFVVSVTAYSFSAFDGAGFISPGFVRPDPAEFLPNLRDFDGAFSTIVRFPPSTSTQEMEISITTNEDTVDEATEGFFLLVTVNDESSEIDSQNSNALADGLTLIVILDNDDLLFSWSVATAVLLSEPLSGNSSVISDIGAMVIKTGTTERSVEVDVNAENNTAFEGIDFIFPQGFQLTFAPQDTSLGVSVTLINDDIVEPTERFLLTLALPAGESSYNISEPSMLEVEISDTDSAVIGFQMSDYTISENSSSVVVTVALLQPASGSLLDDSVRFSYNIQTTSGSATGGGVDFSDFSSLGTIDSQSVSNDFTISIISDNMTESDEQFTVSASPGGLSIGSFSIQPASATVTIQDGSSGGGGSGDNGDGGTGGGMGGDPHFSILLPTNQLLCFSVQGEAGFNFNLISNDFLQLNGLFVSDPSKKGITWIGAMGLTVKGSKYKQLNDTKIRFMAEEEMIYLGDKVKLYPQRVKTIKLSHGSLKCHEREDEYTGPLHVFVDLEDVGLQFTVKFVKAKHIDVVWNKVMRQPKNSHGLIGQFLRAGIDIDETRQLLLLPNLPPVPVTRRQVWRFMERDVPEEQDCWMAMNWGNQGKGLIEGSYLEYSVSDLLASDSMN